MNPQFNKGDRISFIDQKIDGSVKELKSNGRLLIETDDGFDISASPSEIILVRSVSDTKSQNPEQDDPVPQDVTSTGSLAGITEKNTLTFLTQAYQEKKVLTGRLRHILVNNLDSSVLFCAYKLNPEPFLFSEGLISAQSISVIAETEREEIAETGDIIIQYLICSPKNISRPGKIRLTPKAPGLEDAIHGEDNFTLFCTRRILYTHLSNEEYDLSFLLEKYRKGSEASITRYAPSKFRKAQKEKNSFDTVVDLHIEELVDDLNGLTPSSMLEIQRLELARNLNEFIRSGSHKLVIIHGVGKGVLKKAVYEEVAKYQDLRCAPADPTLYGSGATEILVR